MISITNLKSSNKEGPAPESAGAREVAVASGLRLRGNRGRLTARLVAAGIDQLEGRESVLVGRPGGATRRLRVEEHSTYGDRVVLKFAGIDDAAAAADLVGQDILMP